MALVSDFRAYKSQTDEAERRGQDTLAEKSSPRRRRTSFTASPFPFAPTASAQR
jgi:hypothetical protein